MADSTKTSDVKPDRFPPAVWKFVEEPNMPNIEHTGGCHCGAVRFRMQHPALTRQPDFHFPVKMCNCGICGRNGYLAVFPERHELEWLSGEDALVNYTFATHKKLHRFCGRCGSSVCMDMSGSWKSWAGDVIAVNVRMLDDFDFEDLNFHKKDGKSFIPQ